MRSRAILAACAIAAACSVIAALTFVAGDALASPLSQDGFGGCGPTTLTIEREGQIVFKLPEQAGEKLELDPDEPLTVRVRNAPPAGAVVVRLLLPFGQSVEQSYSWSGLQSGSEYVRTIDPADYGESAGLVRGAYGVEIELRAGDPGDAEPCVIPAVVQVGSGVEGPVGRGALWGAVIAGIGSIALAAWAGSNAGNGGRPILRTVAAVVLGAVTGVLAALALQQAGNVTLTSLLLVVTALSGAVGAFLIVLFVAGVVRMLRMSKPITP